ncbi:hypothetical protein [Ferrimonas pelagia]|uniref:Uncharacterized protein n=1 Tax=Ferrimonas pelagia TaxID=1177826 RepID=A0ABP9F252_9GAMM
MKYKCLFILLLLSFDTLATAYHKLNFGSGDYTFRSTSNFRVPSEIVDRDEICNYVVSNSNLKNRNNGREVQDLKFDAAYYVETTNKCRFTFYDPTYSRDLYSTANIYRDNGACSSGLVINPHTGLCSEVCPAGDYISGLKLNNPLGHQCVAMGYSHCQAICGSVCSSVDNGLTWGPLSYSGSFCYDSNGDDYDPVDPDNPTDEQCSNSPDIPACNPTDPVDPTEPPICDPETEDCGGDGGTDGGDGGTDGGGGGTDGGGGGTDGGDGGTDGGDGGTDGGDGGSDGGDGDTDYGLFDAPQSRWSYEDLFGENADEKLEAQIEGARIKLDEAIEEVRSIFYGSDLDLRAGSAVDDSFTVRGIRVNGGLSNFLSISNLMYSVFIFMATMLALYIIFRRD